jgi:L-ascorbate metabolism protein UlaG (beta-lactamase superfamily)
MAARLLFALLLLLPRLAAAGCSPIAEARVWRASADGVVTITFLGHASFEIETPRGIRAVTDYSGDFPPPEVPDLVTMNHAHTTHFTLHPNSGIRYVLHGWEENGQAAHHDLTLGDLHVSNLPTNIRTWGGETEVNGNSIFIFETAGLCIAHLGHLHHTLEPRDLDTLGHIDVVMVAVDGSWTLSQRDARDVIDQIHPRIVLPMHYFTRDRLARFLDMMRDGYDVQLRTDPVLELSRVTLPERPTVIALPGPH